LVRNRGPWKSIDDLEIAVAEYIDWFGFRRLSKGVQMVSQDVASGAAHGRHASHLRG
jgi:putative transposase